MPGSPSLLFLIGVIVLVAMGIPSLAIATDQSERTLPRAGWWIWTVVCISLGLVLNSLSSFVTVSDNPPSINADGVVFLILSAAYVLVLPWMLARRFLWRVRDAGWNPNYAYSYALPGFGLVPWIMMLFVPSRRAPSEEMEPAHS